MANDSLNISTPSFSLPVNSPSIYTPYVGTPTLGRLKKTHNTKVYAKDLGDILLGDLVYGTKQMQNTLDKYYGKDSDIKYIPILNRAAAAAAMFKQRNIDPIFNSANLLKGLRTSLVNTFESAGSSMDLFSNPIKSLFAGAGGGKPGDFLRSMGWKDGEYRSYFQWDTGNFLTNIELEMLSDPLTWYQSLSTKVVSNAGEALSTDLDEFMDSIYNTKNALSNAESPYVRAMLDSDNKVLPELKQSLRNELMANEFKLNESKVINDIKARLNENIVTVENKLKSLSPNTKAYKELAQYLNVIQDRLKYINSTELSTNLELLLNSDNYRKFNAALKIRKGYTKYIDNYFSKAVSISSGTEFYKRFFNKLGIPSFKSIMNNLHLKLNDYIQGVKVGKQVSMNTIKNEIVSKNIAARHGDWDKWFGLTDLKARDINTLKDKVVALIESNPNATQEDLRSLILKEIAATNSVVNLIINSTDEQLPQLMLPNYKNQIQYINKEIDTVLQSDAIYDAIKKAKDNYIPRVTLVKELSDMADAIIDMADQEKYWIQQFKNAAKEGSEYFIDNVDPNQVYKAIEQFILNPEDPDMIKLMTTLGITKQNLPRLRRSMHIIDKYKTQLYSYMHNPKFDAIKEYIADEFNIDVTELNPLEIADSAHFKELEQLSELYKKDIASFDKTIRAKIKEFKTSNTELFDDWVLDIYERQLKELQAGRYQKVIDSVTFIKDYKNTYTRINSAYNKIINIVKESLDDVYPSKAKATAVIKATKPKISFSTYEVSKPKIKYETEKGPVKKLKMSEEEAKRFISETDSKAKSIGNELYRILTGESEAVIKNLFKFDEPNKILTEEEITDIFKRIYKHLDEDGLTKAVKSELHWQRLEQNGFFKRVSTNGYRIETFKNRYFADVMESIKALHTNINVQEFEEHFEKVLNASFGISTLKGAAEYLDSLSYVTEAFQTIAYKTLEADNNVYTLGTNPIVDKYMRNILLDTSEVFKQAIDKVNINMVNEKEVWYSRLFNKGQTTSAINKSIIGDLKVYDENLLYYGSELRTNLRRSISVLSDTVDSNTAEIIQRHYNKFEFIVDSIMAFESFQGSIAELYQELFEQTNSKDLATLYNVVFNTLNINRKSVLNNINEKAIIEDIIKTLTRLDNKVFVADEETVEVLRTNLESFFSDYIKNMSEVAKRTVNLDVTLYNNIDENLNDYIKIIKDLGISLQQVDYNVLNLNELDTFVATMANIMGANFAYESDFSPEVMALIRANSNNNMLTNLTKVFETIGTQNDIIANRHTVYTMGGYVDVLDKVRFKENNIPLDLVSKKELQSQLANKERLSKLVKDATYGTDYVVESTYKNISDLNIINDLGIKLYNNTKFIDEHFLSSDYLHFKGSSADIEAFKYNFYIMYEHYYNKVNEYWFLHQGEIEFKRQMIKDFFGTHVLPNMSPDMNIFETSSFFYNSKFRDEEILTWDLLLQDSNFNPYYKSYRDMSYVAQQEFLDINAVKYGESLTEIINNNANATNFHLYQLRTQSVGEYLDDDYVYNFINNLPGNQTGLVWDAYKKEFIRDYADLSSKEAQQIFDANLRQNYVQIDKLKDAANTIANDERIIGDLVDFKDARVKSILQSYGIKEATRVKDATVQAFLEYERQDQLIKAIWDLSPNDLRAFIDTVNPEDGFILLRPDNILNLDKRYSQNLLNKAGLAYEIVYDNNENVLGVLFTRTDDTLRQAVVKLNQPNYIIKQLQQEYDALITENNNYINWHTWDDGNKSTEIYRNYYSGKSYNPNLIEAIYGSENITPLKQKLYPNQALKDTNKIKGKNSGRPDFIFLLDTNRYNDLQRLVSNELVELGSNAMDRTRRLDKELFSSVARSIANTNRADKYISLFFEKDTDYQMNSPLMKAIFDGKTAAEKAKILKANNMKVAILKADKKGNPFITRLFIQTEKDWTNAMNAGAIIVSHELYRSMVLTCNKREVTSKLLNIIHMFIKPTYMTSYLFNIGFPIRNYIDSGIYKNASTTDGTSSIIKNLYYEVQAYKKLDKYNKMIKDIIDISKELTGKESINKRIASDYLLGLSKADQELFLFMSTYTNSYAATVPTEIEAMWRRINIERGYLKEGKDALDIAIRDLGRQYDDALANDIPIMNAIMNANNTVEQVSRLGLLLNLMDNGHSSTDALRRVVDTHFDYELKDMGQKYLSDIFMFETFPINNVLYYLNDEYMDSSMTRLYLDVLEQSYNSDGITWDDVRKSDYLAYNALAGNIRIGQYIFKTGSSLADFLQTITNIVGTAQERLNPVIRSFVNRDISELNPFTGQVSRYNQIKKAIGSKGKEGSYLPSLYAKLYLKNKKKYNNNYRSNRSGSWTTYPKKIKKPNLNYIKNYRTYAKPYYFKHPNTIDWKEYTKFTSTPYFKLPARTYDYYKRKLSKGGPEYLTKFDPTIY